MQPSGPRRRRRNRAMTGGALRTLTEREKKGDIFTNDEKQRMSEAFAIPDLALMRGDLMEREKDFKWTGTAQFVEILSQGYTIGEATQMLKLNVSPLHFAMALLGSRGQHIEDPYLVAAMFGIDQSQLTAGMQAAADTTAELLAKWSPETEPVEAFVKRIQNDLTEHIEMVQKLHDQVFSYKHRIVEVSSREGKPERRVTGGRIVKQPHSATWDLFQDCSVLEGSAYYKSKPWPRSDQRHHDAMKHEVGKLEELRKTRDLQARAARDMERQSVESPKSSRENMWIGVAKHPASKPETLARQSLTIPSRILEQKMARTQRQLTTTVMHLHSAAWAREFNNEAIANRHLPQRPLSALHGPRNFPAELYARYAEETMPKVKLPMTALPGGTEPSKGVMTHTGAFCPSFDKEWTIKDVCNRDLSDEDHTLLASFNLFVKKSEPAEPTAKLDRMPPGMLKESSTLTGGAEARRHRPGRGLNTPTDTPSPQGSSRSTPMLRTSQRRGLGRNQEVQFSLLNDQRDVDKDVLFEYDAYVRKRLSTAVPTTVPSSLLHASSKSSNMRDSRSCLGLGTTTRTEPPVPFLSDGKANTCVQEDANDRNEDTILFERGHSLRGEMLGVHTELGMFLKSAAEKLGAGLETQDDYMIRGPGATISQGFVDVPPSGKIELSEIVARTPQGRLGDLVLLQTGLPRAIVRERKEGCRFREIRDLHHHSPCSSFHGTKTQANAHQQSMLRWMETRKMLGSVRDEFKRLEDLHHTMLSINEQLLRVLDAVAISAAPKCHDAEFSTPLNVSLRRSEFIRNDTMRDTIWNPEIRDTPATLRPHPPKVPDSNAADSPGLSSSQNMRKTVEVESDEYKRKLESHRHMLREIESEILSMRKTLHMYSQTDVTSTGSRLTSDEVDDRELTIVVLNLHLRPHQSPIILDTSFVHGRFSRSVCELLQMMNIDCQEVASAEEVDARGWLNILWMSSMWLISSSNGGCSVRDIMNLHRTQLHALIAELAPIAQLAHMRDFDHLSGAGEDVLGLPVRDAHVAGNDLLQVDTVMCDMEARSRQYLVGAIVPCKQGALRQLQWLNGSFLRKTGSSGQPQRLHIELLQSQGVDVTLLELQGERQRLQASRLHQCLLSLPSRPRDAAAHAR